MNAANHSKPECLVTIFIFIAIVIQLTSSLYHAWPFTTDDAFIGWRYARHLAEGKGLYWNPTGIAVEGYSNFAWVLFSSLLIKLGLPLIFTVKGFACLSLVVGLFFLYQFSRTFFSPLPAILPVYIFSKYHGVIWWTVSGLETSFFVTLALFVVWQSTRAMGFEKLKQSSFHSPNYLSNSWLMACLGLTLLALTRFEGVIWSLIIGVFVACHVWQSKQHRLSRRNATGRISTDDSSFIYTFILFFVVPYSLYFAWRAYYFGQFLPNSYVCKASVEGYTFQLINDYLPIAFPCFVLGLPYFFARKDCRHILLWLPSLVYMLLLYRADTIVAYHNRLFLGAFSLLTLLPVLGLHEFFSYFHYTAKKNALLSTISILLFAHFFIPTKPPVVIDAAVANYQQRNAIRIQIARQLNQESAQGARILVGDSGVIPFFARKDLIFIDSLCLNNVDMTRQSLPLYALYMQRVIKPEWAIDTYYPITQGGSRLDKELRKNGFFASYKFVSVYKAHQFLALNDKVTQKQVDYIYRVYNSG